MILVFLYCLLIEFHFCDTQGNVDDPNSRYDYLFKVGKEAYLEEKWYECYQSISGAIKDYKLYQNKLIDCHLKCHKQITTNVSSDHYLDLAFFDIAIKKADCIRSCKAETLGNSPDSESEDIQELFRNLDQYDYLQICAFKVGKLEEAVSSAYTYHLAHPEHQTMKNNIAFYKSLNEVKSSYFYDREARPHMEYYEKGVAAYGEEDWASTVDNMEQALLHYYVETDKCRMLCEGPSTSTDSNSQDFYTAITEHYIKLLGCMFECPGTLATSMGKEIDDFLPEHFNYLQFAYYKMGNMEKAAESVMTYLMFKPDDDSMLSNKEYYLANHVNQQLFKTRKNAKQYFDRQYQEIEQLMFTQKHYLSSNTKYSNDAQEQRYQILFMPKDEKYHKKMKTFEDKGMIVKLKDKELQGENRFAADGILSEDECQQLIELVEVGGKQGDGYAGREHRPSPHTDYERYSGLTITRAAELSYEGHLPTSLTKLYMSASELAREYMEKYFNLKSHLYLDYTHLVCRSAIPDAMGTKSADELPLSHPVHADNCHIQGDGSCLKEKPAYISRDFSSLVYLNGDFEGGDFFFAHPNLTVQQKVRPKCGRIVGFMAKDYHGVQAVTKGKRCALALWYTLDPTMQENRGYAKDLLMKAQARARNLHNPELKLFMDKNKLELVATEKELNGPERFAADNLLTKEECQTLIKLTNTGGQVGDGYPGTKGTSPHTTHELFMGLTVSRAAELLKSKKASKESVKLFIDIAEKGRHMVETYFNLKSPLYFDFTHLVCRRALDDKNDEREDLSHPIHADNCLIQKDNSCNRVPPAYIQREYSAILYLNEEFTGGDFFFTHQNMSIASILQPRCGRLVGFNAGNYHGVKAVLSGQRCALAMWYTLDRRFKEKAHEVAEAILGQAALGKPLGPPQAFPHGGEL